MTNAIARNLAPIELNRTAPEGALELHARAQRLDAASCSFRWKRFSGESHWTDEGELILHCDQGVHDSPASAFWEWLNRQNFYALCSVREGDSRMRVRVSHLLGAASEVAQVVSPYLLRQLAETLGHDWGDEWPAEACEDESAAAFEGERLQTHSEAVAYGMAVQWGQTYSAGRVGMLRDLLARTGHWCAELSDAELRATYGRWFGN